MSEWININEWNAIDEGAEIMALKKEGFVIGKKDRGFLKDNWGKSHWLEDIVKFQIFTPPGN